MGIGDDAAVLSMPQSSQLVMTMDTLIEGVHFPPETTPSDIAHKALAVNLSDLAAMGATPAWFLLSIALPSANEDWLQQFAQTLCQQASHYGIKLIGGDTCKGPLSITIQATGIVAGKPLLRTNAKLGDHVFVSGTLGLAALGLAIIQGNIKNVKNEKTCIKALNCPNPRFDVADLVKPYANAMIDISDGLLADLSHILTASQCGAEIYLEQIPMVAVVQQGSNYYDALNAGDDYELCFTVPQESLNKMHAVLQDKGIKVYDIGQITASELILYKAYNKQQIALSQIKGFQHFG